MEMTLPIESEGPDVPGLRVTSFSGEEYLAVAAVVKNIFTACKPEDPPKFVIIMGGVGAGKTTLRREKYGRNYVHYDFDEICLAVIKVFGKDHPRLVELLALASDIVFKDSIHNKRNIVIEIIGNDEVVLKMVIDKMVAIGYQVHVELVTCDIAEAYQRHLKAVKEDPEYSSAYYSQDATLNSFLSYDLEKLLLDA